MCQLKRSFLAPLLLALISLGSLGLLQAEEDKLSVAKVNDREIQDLVKKVVLNKPENAKIAAKYLAQQKAEEEAQEKMQQAIINGEEFNPMDFASSFANSSLSTSKELQTLCDKHLLELIESKFGQQYDLILKEGYDNPVLYTQLAIVDITELLRQELLKQLPQRKE